MGGASGREAGPTRPAERAARLALWATLLGGAVGLLAVATAVAWEGGSGVVERSAPAITSPTTEVVPPPTLPDPARFEALGLPPPPPPPAPPTVHEIVPGVNAPHETSPPVAAQSPPSTVTAVDQRVAFSVHAPGQPTTTTVVAPATPTTGPGSVLGGTVDRGTAPGGSGRARGPLARTGAWLVLPLAVLGAALLATGSALRVGARRRTRRSQL